MAGLDSAAYASTDYDLKTLQGDYQTLARQLLAPFGQNPPPLIVGGWSMGGAQAIAVAGGPNPPPKLKGVLIASALSRGRYGLRISDQLNILPTGPGTFAVDDFAHDFNSVPIVQWHGAQDTIDSCAWLKDLKNRHREYDFPNAGHTYNNACETFQHQFLESANWLLNGTSTQDLHAQRD